MDNWASTVLPLAILVLAFVFLVVRPARTRQREFVRLQQQLEPGQQIMIASGIFGEIVSLEDETIQMRVAPDTVLTVNRHAVGRVIPAETESSTDDL